MSYLPILLPYKCIYAVADCAGNEHRRFRQDEGHRYVASKDDAGDGSENDNSTPSIRAPAWPKLLVSVTRLVIRNPRNSGKTPSTPDNAPKTIASTIACFQIHALADAPY
mgnify:CR=1 FL=1